MITVSDKNYILSTADTQYMFRVSAEGHLEHLHYGAIVLSADRQCQKETVENAVKALCDKKHSAGGTSTIYREENGSYCLEDMLLECSGIGKGDYRQPMIELCGEDGVTTTDFVFGGSEIIDGTVEAEGLPCAYVPDVSEYKENDKTLGDAQEEKAETLAITLKDAYTNTELVLYYTVFQKANVIVRKALFINTSDKTLKLTKLMSMQLDLPGTGYRFTSFNGNWAREMVKNDTIVNFGTHVNQSIAGVSSNRANPFVMVSSPEATETSGACIGVNLVYSGNHMESLEVGGYENTRLLSGIHPQNFAFSLAPGEKFFSPEAVLTYSGAGYRHMSENLHFFVRNHIVRGEWKFKERPILLNSWEACYFKLNERRLLKLARAARKAGIELFVMDDGWFAERNSDSTSLGDWQVNKKKLPHGLKGLSDKIHRMGMLFGIWVEPEMISEESALYKKHPDWAMKVPGKEQSLGRHQMFLDLANPEVQDFVIDSVSSILESAKIEYVKWDMNRMMSDVYSMYLPKERQGETMHRYYLGLYRIMDTLNKRFPSVLFEGCASGGNRFDLGILSYMPQIWASDNTDAVSRIRIQEGYSYAYPQSTYTAHVSNCPNHQTMRTTPLETRFDVASFGLMGYEFNLPELSKKDREAVKEQVETYKKYRNTLQFGTFYRRKERLNDGEVSWSAVNADKSQAVSMEFVLLQESNEGGRYLTVPGLSTEKTYHLHNRKTQYDIRLFGDLVNMMSPVRIKQNGFLHNLLAKFVHIPGETEDVKATGALLGSGHLALSRSFCGTGIGENARVMGDFASRLYFVEEE